ncbi:MAG: glycosyltransferase family 39 protein [Leptolyngbyaceae cyanobacterium MO_188.B28]|nr:glycosyltransferase family 39 protein [Leptolyngbyaceae cyanobacterium MO_188.B28]
MKRQNQRILLLLIIVLLGAALRFWSLDSKPLWHDELYTALYSLGKTPSDIPMAMVYPVTQLRSLITLDPSYTLSDVVEGLNSQSSHPPLFFMLMHGWLNWMGSNTFQLRAFSAWIGVSGIVAIYGLGRLAFNQATGLLAAVLFAVSPFSVYLAQEARHYTLPLLLLTLALAGLIAIIQDLTHPRSLRLWVCLGWCVVNGVGFYIHYLFLLSTLAQLLCLAGAVLRWRRSISNRNLFVIGFFSAAIGLSYLPWLPTLLSQTQGAEDAWLNFDPSYWSAYIEPLIRVLAAWIMMYVLLPVERMPSWIVIPSAIAMLGFIGWLGVKLAQGWSSLGAKPTFRVAASVLISFTGWILFETLMITYGLGIDFTQSPRYLFQLYPAVCVLTAAFLLHASQIGSLRSPNHTPNHSSLIVITVGLVSCVLINLNITLLKPYLPDRVAAQLLAGSGSHPPVILMAAPRNFDRTLGLAYALEVEKQAPKPTETYWGFFQTLPEANDFSSVLGGLEQLPRTTLNLWLISPGEYISFPETVLLGADRPACRIEEPKYNTEGNRYQQYRCL